ncbi:hypothetical protein [Rubinisphaera sp. JC750]|uniref:hypothetical protein n=1 Tax=Rubinisphaera sp. JC750 TaxID=2898658 RepID=UPI001F3CD60A|nr:hypothetical protein [Rubinisphaera sp. JC750]
MMDVQEPFLETGFQRWRRLFPWLHLLRVPLIAGTQQILVVGFVASYLLMTLDLLTIGYSSHAELPDMVTLAASPTTSWLSLAAPNTTLYILFEIWGGQEQSMFQLNMLLSLVIYAFVGLVIGRMAAGRFTTGHQPCLEHSVLFGFRKLPSFALSLLFPAIALVLMYAAIRGLLALEFIPTVGPWIAGATYGLALLLMAIAIVLMFGLIIGWPLLIATLSVENSDGFDAWSRSFDYVSSRLVPMFLAFALTTGLGLIVLGFLGELATLTFYLTDEFQARVLGVADSEITDRAASTFQTGPTGFQNLWRTLVTSLVNGYMLTLYWSAVIGVYLLTRFSVDRIPLDEFCATKTASSDS